MHLEQDNGMYKGAMFTSLELLKWALTIEFSGEGGADAGALTLEFIYIIIVILPKN